MSVYEYGGIYDYLADIHFPGALRGKIPQNQSAPWYYFMQVQNPSYFSFLGGTWGNGWGYRHILPVIKILAADTQPMTPTSNVGSDSLEAAVDSYVKRWDSAGPANAQDPAFFGRMNFGNRFFWKVLGEQYPDWASNFKGLITQRKNDNHRPIGPYIEDAVTKYFDIWNSSTLAYNAQSASIPPSGDPWDPLTNHGYAIPYPHPTVKEGGTFSSLSKSLQNGTAFLGPIPASAWSRFLIIFTQAYGFTYGIGQLDPNEWDQSAWPPRRTSIPQREGGSGKAPSGISGKWGGVDPFQDFPSTQFTLV